MIKKIISIVILSVMLITALVPYAFADGETLYYFLGFDSNLMSIVPEDSTTSIAVNGSIPSGKNVVISQNIDSDCYIKFSEVNTYKSFTLHYPPVIEDSYNENENIKSFSFNLPISKNSSDQAASTNKFDSITLIDRQSAYKEINCTNSEIKVSGQNVITDNTTLKSLPYKEVTLTTDADSNVFVNATVQLYEAGTSTPVQSITPIGNTATFVMPDCDIDIDLTYSGVTTYYGVYINGGEEITSKNLSGTIGTNGGTYKYSPISKTLTLTNAELSNSNSMTNDPTKEYSIYFTDTTPADITIKLVGDTTISLPTTTTNNYYGIYAGNNNLTITGDSLTMQLPSNAASGITANSVTINNSTTITNEETTALGTISGVTASSVNVSEGAALNVDIKNASLATGIAAQTLTSSGVVNVNSNNSAGGKSVALQFNTPATDGSNITVNKGYIIAKGGTNAVYVLTTTEDTTVLPTISANSGKLMTMSNSAMNSVEYTDASIGSTNQLEIHHPASITISETPNSVEEGSTINPTATVTYAAETGTTVEDSNVEWSSSNQSVATVSEDGTVSGIANGTTVLTAKSVYDDNINNTLSVTVSEKITASTPADDNDDEDEDEESNENGQDSDETQDNQTSSATVTTDSNTAQQQTTSNPAIRINEESVQLVKGLTESVTLTVNLTDITSDKLEISTDSSNTSIKDNIELSGNTITVKWVDGVTTIPQITVSYKDNPDIKDTFKAYYINFADAKLSKVTQTSPTFTELAGGMYVQVSVDAPDAYKDYYSSRINWQADSSGVVSVSPKTDDKLYAFIKPLKNGSAVVTASIADMQGNTTSSVNFSATVSTPSSYNYEYFSANNSIVWYYDNPSNIAFRTTIPANVVSNYGVELTNGTTSIPIPAKYLSITTDTTSGGSTIAISGSFLSSALPKKTVKYQLNTYYGQNTCITRPFYVRSVYDSPITGDENMTLYYVLTVISFISIIGGIEVLKNSRKNKAKTSKN